MKKILLLTALLLGSTTLFAQSAEELLTRYYKAAGIDRIDPQKASMKISMTVTSNGMEMDMTSIMQMPDKLNVRINTMGQNIILIINNNQGWMNIPGIGAQPLPADQIAQMREQTDLISSMKWDTAAYTLTLLAPAEMDGVKCHVIAMTPKQGKIPFKKATLYMNQATGMPDRMIATVASPQGGDMEATTLYKSYVKMNGITYPAVMETKSGFITVTAKITEFVLDYPVTDEMFAKPE